MQKVMDDWMDSCWSPDFRTPFFHSPNHHSSTCQGEAEDNVPEYIEWAKTDSSIISPFIAISVQDRMLSSESDPMHVRYGTAQYSSVRHTTGESGVLQVVCV